MGLIMLILIGTVPTAYALNRALPRSARRSLHPGFAGAARSSLPSAGRPLTGDAAREPSTTCLATRVDDGPRIPSLARWSLDIDDQVKSYGSIRQVPAGVAATCATRCISPPRRSRVLAKTKAAVRTAARRRLCKDLQGQLDKATKFIPTWVKVAVALALGLGTMVGWKRIVVTVGEKIGKTHLTYAQGASAETRRDGDDRRGRQLSACRCRPPTSCPRGVAGTMAANGSGHPVVDAPLDRARRGCSRSPAAMAISGLLFFIFAKIF